MPKEKIRLIIWPIILIFLLGGYWVMKEKEKAAIYPKWPIKMIVAFGAGGGDDLQARALEKFVGQKFGQPLIVLNKPGAAGVIGWNEVVRAAPDGYTLGISETNILLHTLYDPNETHYLTRLDPIAQIASVPSILVVNADQPWYNVNDVIRYAKEHPRGLKYGHSGLGSMGHIAGAVFGRATGTELEQVPFHSGSESVAALLGKHIQFAFINPATVKEHLRVGTLRAIAITGQKRLNDPSLRDIPTLIELGVDVSLTFWLGVVAPKELPRDVRVYLEEGFRQIVAEPEFQANMAKMGLEVDYLGHDDSQDKWVKEAWKLKKMLEETGIIDEVKKRKQ